MSVLVFGGRSPIALALCKQLIESGREVHLVTRKVDAEIKSIVTRLNISALHQCDLIDTESAINLVKNIDERVKRLSGVAFLHRYRGDKSSPKDQYVVEVLTPFKIIESLTQVKREIELPIVLTSSPAATKVVSDQDFQYHASKAAIEQLVRFSAVRFSESKLRTNGINPGTYVYKERASDFYRENPEVLKVAERQVPLGRIASVDEIAAVAMFLLGEQSSFVNGTIITIDGGHSIRIDD
jgi:NAD(P)-dependent dehydrogenase (short-subunit alcohol dehydrogenase family)